jgi:hypothetical protein
MTNILELKTWEKVSYQARPDAAITMELRRLKRHEAKPLMRVLIACFAESEKAGADGLTNAQRAAIVNQVFDVVPDEQMREWFAKNVRNVGGLYVDGQAITTGIELLDEADDGLILFVLLKLRDLAGLTEKEGKASSSPSRFTSLPAPSDSTSPAGSTESADGPQPSAVTVEVLAASSSESPTPTGESA